MGEKFSWDRLMKRNKEEGAEDNTIDLAPEPPSMGPVASLKATGESPAPVTTPPSATQVDDRPRPPLVIDWDEYEQPAPTDVSTNGQAVPPAPVVPPVTNTPIEIPPASIASVPPTQVPSEPIASAPVPPAIAPPSTTLGTPEPNQFWEKLGENTTQAMSVPGAPAVAGWDDVELTPRERSGARLSSDQLAGTVEPNVFTPIDPELKIEETIQSISQSPAWDEPVYVSPVTVEDAPPASPSSDLPPVTHEPIETLSDSSKFTVHDVEPAAPLAPIEFNSMPIPSAEYPADPGTEPTPIQPIAAPAAITPPTSISPPPVNPVSQTNSLPPVQSEPEASTAGGFWDTILTPNGSAGSPASTPEPVSESTNEPAPVIEPPMSIAVPAPVPPVNEVPTEPEPIPHVEEAYATAPVENSPTMSADAMFELPTDEATLQEARDIRLGEVLVNHRLVTQAQIDRAVETQQKTGQKLGEVLVSMGMVSERRLLQVLAAQKGVSPWHLEEDAPSPDAVKTLPYETCKTHQVLPVAVRGELLLLAMRDTQDLAAIELVRAQTGRRVEPVLADTTQLAAHIERLHGAMPDRPLVDPAVEAFDNAPIAPLAPVENVATVTEEPLEPEVVEDSKESTSPLTELPKLQSIDAALDWLNEEPTESGVKPVVMPQEIGFKAEEYHQESEVWHAAPEAFRAQNAELPIVQEAVQAEASEVANNESWETAEQTEEPFSESTSCEETNWTDQSVPPTSESDVHESEFSADEPIAENWEETAQLESAEGPVWFASEDDEEELTAIEPDTQPRLIEELIAEAPSVDYTTESEPETTDESHWMESTNDSSEPIQPELVEAESVVAHSSSEWVESTPEPESNQTEEIPGSKPEWTSEETSEAWEEQVETQPEIQSETDWTEVVSEEVVVESDQESPVPASSHAHDPITLNKLFQKAATLNARGAWLDVEEGGAHILFQFARSTGHRQVLDLDEVESLIGELANAIGFDPRTAESGTIAAVPAQIDDFRFAAEVSALTTSLGTRIKFSFPQLRLPVRGIRDLGLESENAKLVESLLHQPYGLFLICGPAASGKTTTLYAIASELQRCGCTVITCESPIEADLPGVHQIESNGQNLDSLVDAVLRQGADRVFIGEIRDIESAQLVVDAALAGCAVIATIRALDSSDAIETLLDWGIAPHRLARALNGVLAQRLIRTLGEGAYKTDEVTSAEAEALKQYFGNPQIRELPRPAAHESWDGYAGETAIHEVFVNSEETAALIACHKPLEQVMEAAGYYGYLPLRFDGLRRIANGETTLDELRRTIALRPLRKSEPRTLAS